MSYNPATDFLALIRSTGSGARLAQVPGLDYVLAAMARAGLFTLYVGQTAPASNQSTTVWLVPAAQSWTAEGAVFLWNSTSGAYEPATPALWAVFLARQVVQDVTTPGPVNILANAGIVRVNQAVSAPTTLILPVSSLKVGEVLVSDWKGDAGANNILLQTQGADRLPGNRTDWTISGDGGSLCFRPVTGGYVL